jgi:hypothetical protein
VVQYGDEPRAGRRRSTWPLTQAVHAHQALLDRENLGKVVLVT